MCTNNSDDDDDDSDDARQIINARPLITFECTDNVQFIKRKLRIKTWFIGDPAKY